MPRDDDDGGLASVLVIAGIFGGTGCCRPQIVWRPLLSHTGEKPTQANPPKKKEGRFIHWQVGCVFKNGATNCDLLVLVATSFLID